MKIRFLVLSLVTGFAWALCGLSPAIASTLTHGRVCTIVGTDAADTLVGTDGDDVICGLGGNDEIVGGSGDDIIDAGAGNDSVTAGPGADKLFLGDGSDALSAGPGDDLAEGGAGNDILDMGDGDDKSYGGPGADKLFGDGGSDSIHGGDNLDWMSGGTGSDITDGDRGNNRCSGDPNDVRKHCTFNNTGPQLISIALADESRTVDTSSPMAILHLRARVTDYGGGGLVSMRLGFIHPAGNDIGIIPRLNDNDNSLSQKQKNGSSTIEASYAAVNLTPGEFNTPHYAPHACSPEDLVPNQANAITNCLFSGDAFDGIYDIRVALDANLRQGKYWLASFAAKDANTPEPEIDPVDPMTNTGWAVDWKFTNLQARGFNVAFNQIAPRDSTPPKIISVAVNRSKINTYFADSLLSVRIRVADPSGLAQLWLYFERGLSPEDDVFSADLSIQSSSCDPPAPVRRLHHVHICQLSVSDDGLDAVYEASWIIPKDWKAPPVRPAGWLPPTYYLRVELTDGPQNSNSVFFAPTSRSQKYGSAYEGKNNRGKVIGVTFAHHR